MIIELEVSHLSSKRNKIHFQVDTEARKVYVEINSLPFDMLLCCMLDGVDMFQSEVGLTKKKKKKCFIPVDWIIDEWGGDKEIVEAFKIRRQMELDKIPYYQEKYKNQE